MAKKFMFVCLGILALVVAYHLGASSAESQTGTFVGIGGGAYMYQGMFAITADGDCYSLNLQSSPYRWSYVGNPLNGAATQPTTWGQIKADFAE